MRFTKTNIVDKFDQINRSRGRAAPKADAPTAARVTFRKRDPFFVWLGRKEGGDDLEGN
jgi:hypothetical protein